MQHLLESLKNTFLFKNIHEESLKELLTTISYKVTEYSKDQLIALEGDPCNTIGVIIKGTVIIKKLLENGNSITIENFKKGNIFGEVIIYSEIKKYPSTIVASSNCVILFIAKEEITKLCSENPVFLANFMGLLSNKILMLSRRLKNLSYGSIRQKLVNYILEEYRKQQTISILLPHNKTALGEYLGIPRPSISREFMKLKAEGLISYNKNTLVILDLETLCGFLNY